MPPLNIQRRGIAQSPSQANLNNDSSILSGANHFHNRNQSMDVVNTNKIKAKLQNRKRAVQETQPDVDPGQQSSHDDGHTSAGRNAERFKQNSNASRGGNDYLWF